MVCLFDRFEALSLSPLKPTTPDADGVEEPHKGADRLVLPVVSRE